MTRHCLLLALVVAVPACAHHDAPAAPLGLLPASADADWQMDCHTWILRASVCGRDPWTPFCALSRDPSGALYGLDGRPLPAGRGVLATHRIRCLQPHSWTVWTDDRDRIVGACSDPDYVFSGLESVRELLDAHLGHEFARVTMDSVMFAPGIHGWTEPVGLELRHEPDGSIVEDRSKVRPGPPAGCLEVILDD